MTKNKYGTYVAGVFCLALLAACGDDDNNNNSGEATPTPSSSSGVRRVISQVESIDAGVLATLRSGAAPAANGGPTASTAATGTVVNGGSSLVNLSAASPAKRVFVWVRTTGAAQELDGYWDVALPNPSSDIDIQVTIAQAADTVAQSFDCIYALVDETGRVGTPATTQVQVVPVGTGDIQVSVSWDKPSDVDLHVIEPSGEEIYYGEEISATGGNLDLDSNAACNISGVNNENITWPSGRAPRGMYTVRVAYWSSCGVAETNYVVTVQRGGAPETFRGTLTGEGIRGGAGTGMTIAQFTY